MCLHMMCFSAMGCAGTVKLALGVLKGREHLEIVSFLYCEVEEMSEKGPRRG